MKDKGLEYVVLTGATGAIGCAIAAALAAEGHNLILICRNEEKGTALVEKLRGEHQEVDIRLLIADLVSTNSVIEAANTLKGLKIKGLIHNAGVMNREYRELPGGLEHTLVVNYYNPVVLTELLLPELLDGASIVFTSSLTRKLWKPRAGELENSGIRDGVNPKKLHQLWIPKLRKEDFSQLGTYGLSKRLITDYAGILSERLRKRGISVNCADPGIVDTGMITMHRWFDPLANIFFRPFIRSPRQGAVPALRAFAAAKTGRIYCKHAIHRI